MVQVLVTLPFTWETWMKTPGSWLQPSTALDVIALWESELADKDLSFSFSLSLTFPVYSYLSNGLSNK